MVHDRSDVVSRPQGLDSVHVAFDEPRLISDAGLLLTASLAERLGVEELVNESVWLGHKVPGAALHNPSWGRAAVPSGISCPTTTTPSS